MAHIFGDFLPGYLRWGSCRIVKALAYEPKRTGSHLALWLRIAGPPRWLHRVVRAFLNVKARLARQSVFGKSLSDQTGLPEMVAS